MKKLFKLEKPQTVDWTASLVVFVVAIPLTLGISLASGVSVEAGIMSAIIGGIVVGLLSGAPLMVSGPAAGLSAIIFQLVQDYGMSGLMYITLMCGVFQLLFAALKSGPVFRLVPNSILNGMLAAIGIIIMFGQLHVLMGQGVPTDFFQGITQLPTSLMSALTSTSLSIILALGVCGVLIQVFWNKLAFTATLKKVPPALIAVLVVTVAALSFEMPRVNVMASSLFSSNIAGLSFSELFSGDIMKIVTMTFMGFMLCLIASSESLLTARALGDLKGLKEDISDKNLNKELAAQGVGNTLCGFFGAIPVTGVIVRSAANITAGAETRWSTIVHGVLVFIFVVFFAFIVNSIPLTALAAVLVFTGWKLMGIDKIRHAYKTSKEDFYFLTGTIVAIISTNLMVGLIVSLVSYVVYINLKKKKSITISSTTDKV